MRKDAAAFQARTDLAVVDQHPADGSEADDDGGGNRPTADADVADGLPLGFVLRDLAISCLGVLVLIAHRPLPRPPTSRFRRSQPSLRSRRGRWAQAGLERCRLIGGPLAATSHAGEPAQAKRP